MNRTCAAASTSPGVQSVSTEDVVHHCKCTIDALPVTSQECVDDKDRKTNLAKV